LFKNLRVLASLLFLLILVACGSGESKQALVEEALEPAAIALSRTTVLPLMTTAIGSGIGGTLSPNDLKSHYNMPFNYTGVDQTIALVAAPGKSNPLNDLNYFSKYYSLPQCNVLNQCFQRIDLSNGMLSAQSNPWTDEIALDTQWAHAIAPAAKIILVQAKSASLSDLFAAVKVAVSQPNVVAVSMSWGSGEFSKQTTSAYDGLFKNYPAIVFFASSGDSGFNGGNQMYPAASPYVTSVGGTSISNISVAASSSTETAWSLTGGGNSLFELMPSFQKTFLTTNNGTQELSLNNGHRAIPDIAYNADPQSSPVAVWIKNNWVYLGGTSAGAPQWAAITANFAQYMKSKGSNFSALMISKGGFNGLLYQTKLQQLDSQAFIDITSGSNAQSNSACLLCIARVGYDDLTGLGVPNVVVLFGHF
jgi:subtilase family serine protease